MFLQQDPMTPRPEEMNAYVYGASNPLRFTDPYGLLVCFGCSRADEMNIHLSADEAGESASTCLPAALRAEFKSRLDAAAVWCQYSGGEDCADTCEGGSSINVYEPGLQEIGGCGSLASTIFHEVLHQVGGLSEDEVRAFERSCVRGAP